MLAEAAFHLLFAKTADAKNPYKILDRILSVVVGEVERGDYDVGGDGELVAMILCMPLLPLYINFGQQVYWCVVAPSSSSILTTALIR